MTIDTHTIKEIDFTNLDGVKIDSISEGLYCGRRFQINEGGDYVIFNDLYRKARKLARQADNPDKLAQVKAFVGKLRTVEQTANEAYENQECGYKFISWFHRLFGGAFFGSHLNRLDVLNEKIANKAALPKLQSFLKQKISNEDLSILMSFLKNKSITLPWKEGSATLSYNSWSQKIVFTTSENKKLFIDYENDFDLRGEFAEFEEFDGIINALYLEAFSPRASYVFQPQYGGTTYIKVVKAEIEKIPAWHLHQFSENMLPGRSLKVNFLTDSLNQTPGSDSGGLRRDYVSTLMEEIKNLKEFFWIDAGALAMPQIKGSTTAEASQFYFDLGKAFAICYEDGQLVSGCHFNPVLFDFAKMFTTLDLPFDSLDKVARGKMAQAVIKEFDKALSTPNTSLCKVIDLLDEAKLQEALNRDGADEDANLMNAVSSSNLGDYLLMEDAPVDENGYGGFVMKVDIARILANPSKFIDELYDSIMNDPVLVSELEGASLNSIIEPLYRVTQGLGATSWAYLRNDPDLSSKIQGVVDRDKIVNSMQNYNSWSPPPQEKVKWLKDWIKEEASEKELRDFLKYVTGASSLQSGGRIYLQLGPLPNLASHTCSKILEICPDIGEEFFDGTKESFIENVKGVIQNISFQMS